MKLLLYCTKAKPKLYNTDKGFVLTDFELGEYFNNKVLLNGKIVAECDFEVEEIKLLEDNNATMITNTLSEEELLKKSCLEGYELCNYLYDNLWCGQKGYAIHIKNLNIFDKPKELEEVYKIDNVGGKLFTHSLKKAPQNMMYVSANRWVYDFYEPNDINILISIRPEWLCKILNGEKTIEVRKKVLKEMK